MLWFFAVTLFVSASLLFLVQPMIGKMILPRLGGTPAVWNTCMVFFQAVLLVGYAYTHTVSTWQSRRRQLLMQGFILTLPLLVLPFSLGNWIPPEESNPIGSLFWLLLGMVGLPFFVVATSAPLLQKWFAVTPHPAAKDPYFLYGASNLGSMLALLAYPLVVEPNLGVPEQAVLWTVGYAVLMILVLACAALIWRIPESASLEVLDAPAAVATTLPDVNEPTRAVRSLAFKRGRPLPAPATPQVLPRERLTWWRRLRWIGLAAAPSSLMLGVTTYLTTDIAAIPFFWVIPLALYLLTFILVFARWPIVWTGLPHTVVLVWQPVLMVALVFVMMARQGFTSLWLDFSMHILVFFTTTLVCHGELAKDRPSPRFLTEFYLWMSVGGVLGGLFNTLLAPLIFRTGVVEYPLAMILACLLRPPLLMKDSLVPGDSTSEGVTPLGWVLDLGIPMLIGVATWTTLHVDFSNDRGQVYAKAGVAMAIVLLLARPVRMGLSLAAFVFVLGVHDHAESRYVFEDRGFFGFVRVRPDTLDFTNAKGEIIERRLCHVLVHGGINHGQQQLDPRYRRDPITYFHPAGGIGQIFHQFSWFDARLPASLVGSGALDPLAVLVGAKSEPPYAVVGLGTGTLAAHAKPYQHVTFYEIDPIIKRLSDPPPGEKAMFYYLLDAAERGSQVEIRMGDGRLSLQRDPRLEEYYHILVLDAFSSDAIPVHLLTKEAVEMYLTRLAEGGLLVFNITNRYVDLAGILADIAEALDLDCYYHGDSFRGDNDPTKSGSDWVVMQRRNPGKRGIFNGGPPLAERVETRVIQGRVTWQPPPTLGGPIWTDRYSNLLRVLHWRAEE